MYAKNCNKSEVGQSVFLRLLPQRKSDVLNLHHTVTLVSLLTETCDLVTQTETRNSRGACSKHSNTVKQSLSHSPEGARRQTTRGYSVYNVLYLLVLTRDRLYRSANVVSAGYSNFCLPPSHSTPSFGVTPSNLWKSFTVPETRVFRAADGEDLVIIACIVFD